MGRWLGKFWYSEHVLPDIIVLTVVYNVNSWIEYSMDTWATRRMTYMFTCMIGLFIDEDWSLVKHIIDFKVLEDKEHQEWYTAQVSIHLPFAPYST